MLGIRTAGPDLVIIMTMIHWMIMMTMIHGLIIMTMIHRMIIMTMIHGMIMMVVIIWAGCHAAFLIGLRTSSFIHNLTLFH